MPAKKEVGSPMASGDEVDGISLIGSKVEAPGEIFNSPGSTLYGRVTGTPKSRHRRDRCYVRFEEDETEYWFPSKQVASWVVSKGEGKSRLAATRAVASADEDPPTSDYDTNGPTETEAETEAEAEEREPPPPGSRASALAVAAGAEYGVPLGITLAVLVLAGLVWFFAQLWVSERRLARVSY